MLSNKNSSQFSNQKLGENINASCISHTLFEKQTLLFLFTNLFRPQIWAIYYGYAPSRKVTLTNIWLFLRGSIIEMFRK